MSVRSKAATLICLALIAICTPSKADTTKSDKPRTKLEEFLGKTGTLLIVNRFDVGRTTFNSCQLVRVRAIAVYIPGHETDKVKGLVISAEDCDEAVQTTSCFVDIDDAQSLSQALDYMIKISDLWRGDKQIGECDADFITDGGTDVLLAHSADGKHQNVQVRCRGTLTETSVTMPTQNLQELKSLVDAGIDWANKR